MQGEVWQSKMQSIVRSMVQPLVADGGRFEIETCDPDSKRIVVRAAMADCKECAMSEDDLSWLLEEAVQRSDPEASVSVIGGA
jgi:hypothetical protein